MHRARSLLAAASMAGAAALCFPVPAGPGLQAVRGDAQRGREVFRGRGRCVECHRYEGAGSPVRGPAFDAHWRSGQPLGERLKARPQPAGWPESVPGDGWLLQSLLEPAAELTPGYPDRMPPAAGPLLRLDRQDVADLLVYLNPVGPAERAVPPLPPPGPDPWTLLPPGDPARGERIFYRPDDSACSGCHLLRLPRLQARSHPAFWEHGGLTGPELTRVARITRPEQVLESILQPQSRLTAGFEEATVATPGSRLVTGILLGRSREGVLLMQADPRGPVYRWMGREEIDEVLPVARSRMTPVFSDLTGPQERLDLLAFLAAVAEESDALGPAGLPGGPWGSRAPCAPLYTGAWPADAHPQQLQRIPGLPVRALSSSEGTIQESER